LPKFQPFDTHPAIAAIALAYQKQLFDNADGKQILQRSKDLHEYYDTNIHIDKLGNIFGGQLDHFSRARLGPKVQLETDIDNLIRSKWNKPTPLKKSLEFERTFVIKVTPDGLPSISPFKLDYTPQSAPRHYTQRDWMEYVRSTTASKTKDLPKQ
jgi:hypothetical protein